jgi:DNA end-binding protein Ku
VRKPEVEMAKTLVENLSEAFDPDRYRDRYREQLLELIKAKADGEELPEPAEEEEGEVVDLMAALRASVERTQKAKRKQAPARKAS